MPNPIDTLKDSIRSIIYEARYHLSSSNPYKGHEMARCQISAVKHLLSEVQPTIASRVEPHLEGLWVQAIRSNSDPDNEAHGLVELCWPYRHVNLKSYSDSV